jgi:hypothetical protein
LFLKSFLVIIGNMNIKMISGTSVKNNIRTVMSIGITTVFLVGGFTVAPVTVFADAIAPTATVSHIGATKTIILSFSEPVQLVAQSTGAVTPFSKEKIAIYALNASGNYDLSTKANVTIESTSLASNVLTTTYSGTLVKSVDTNYVIDALGYNIVDLSGNPILKSSQTFAVAGATMPGAVLGAQAFHFSLLLKKGSTGNEVVELQKLLTTNGYSIGVADGKFGPKTKNALAQFQIAHGLKGDGIAGALTRAILNK